MVWYIFVVVILFGSDRSIPTLVPRIDRMINAGFYIFLSPGGKSFDSYNFYGIASLVLKYSNSLVVYILFQGPLQESLLPTRLPRYTNLSSSVQPFPWFFLTRKDYCGQVRVRGHVLEEINNGGLHKECAHHHCRSGHCRSRGLGMEGHPVRGPTGASRVYGADTVGRFVWTRSVLRK